METKKRTNLKPLWCLIGILLSGLCLIFSFVVLGHLSSGMGNYWSQDPYVLGMLAIVVTWVAIIFPFAALFIRNDTTIAYLSFIAIGFLIFGAAISIAALSIQTNYNKGNVGKIVGQFILLFAGIIFEFVGVKLSFFTTLKIKNSTYYHR